MCLKILPKWKLQEEQNTCHFSKKNILPQHEGKQSSPRAPTHFPLIYTVAGDQIYQRYLQQLQTTPATSTVHTKVLNAHLCFPPKPCHFRAHTPHMLGDQRASSPHDYQPVYPVDSGFYPQLQEAPYSCTCLHVKYCRQSTLIFHFP